MRHAHIAPVALSLASSLSLALALAPTPARACGGFFCNATTPVPIIQAGERVLFAPHDGLVTMHIEVVYQGDPTKFGWILPVAELPMDADGKPLPLDKAVEISSQNLFPSLQSRTDPIFILTQDPNDATQCQSTFPTGSYADTTSADTAADSGGVDHTPPVVVLQEAAVGPYDAQLIQAETSDALYKWLGDNGYQQDPHAQPILDHYVSKGFKFLGIRLQSGKSTGDLRPLAITLGEAAPCVPLVLTSIAATPGMPVLVWVLGDARAIPKNFIHAVIDDRAFAYPGAPGYQQQVSQAIDDAGHRAWVTEFAGPADGFRGMLLYAGASTASLESSHTLLDAYQRMADLGISTGDLDFDATVRSHVHKPAGLHGYPNGNCYLYPGGSDYEAQCAQQGMANADHETTDAEFYNYLAYWASLDADHTIDLGVDVAEVVQAFEDEIITPRRNIEALFANAKELTRFFTLIDPSEMTRDPIFAFNPDLPDVSNVHNATYNIIDCDSQAVDVVYADGSKAQTVCPSCGFGYGSMSALPGATTLRYPEVLDEEGAPIPFSTTQTAEVDAILDNAAVGIPSLPSSFQAIPPVISLPIDGGGNVGVAGGSDSGCATDAPRALGPFAVAMLATLLALGLIRRRQRG